MPNKLYRIFPPIVGKYYRWNFSDQWLTDQEKTDLEANYPYRVVSVSLTGIPSPIEMNKYAWEQ